jgi:hypothetical protein
MEISAERRAAGRLRPQSYPQILWTTLQFADTEGLRACPLPDPWLLKYYGRPVYSGITWRGDNFPANLLTCQAQLASPKVWVFIDSAA